MQYIFCISASPSACGRMKATPAECHPAWSMRKCNTAEPPQLGALLLSEFLDKGLHEFGTPFCLYGLMAFEKNGTTTTKNTVATIKGGGVKAWITWQKAVIGWKTSMTTPLTRELD